MTLTRYIRSICILTAIAAGIFLPSQSRTEPAKQNTFLSAEQMAAYEKFQNLYKQGKYAEAIPFAENFVELTKSEFGTENINFSIGLYFLASLYSKLGRYSDAEIQGKRALEVQEKKLGPKDLTIATTLYLLATIYSKQGRYAEAVILSKRALAIRKKQLGPEHLATASGLHHLARLYVIQGRYGETRTLLMQVIGIYRKSLRPGHPRMFALLNDLAHLFNKAGRYSKAEHLYRRILNVREKQLGSKHPDTAIILNKLATVYTTQGRYSEAEPLLKRGMAVLEERFGPEHLETATILNSLALLYLKQGRYAEAEALFKRALGLREKQLGSEHFSTNQSVNGLAQLYGEQGRYADAELLFKRAHKFVKQALGQEHMGTTVALLNLVHLYWKLGRYSDAEPLLAGVQAQYERKLGPKHPSTANPLAGMALLSRDQDRQAEALVYSRRAASIIRNRLVLETTRETKGWKSEQKKFRGVFILQTDLALHPDQEGKRRALEGEAFEALQLGRVSSAGHAIRRMSVRLASSTADVDYSLVRARQDTVNQWQAMDKALISALGQPEGKRNREMEARLRSRLSALDTKITELGDALSSKFPKLASIIAPRPIKLQDTYSLLDDDEALVTFARSWAGDKTHVFVVRSNAQKVYTVDLSRKDIWGLINRIRKGLPPLSAFDVGASHELYKRLLGQAEKTLKGVHHLIVVPDGPLMSIPFGVLATGRGDGVSTTADAGTVRGLDIGSISKGKTTSSPGYKSVPWLAKKFALTMLPSVASLKSLRSFAKPTRADKPFIGFGDPILSASKGTEKGIDMVSLFRGGIADVSKIRELSSLPGTSYELKTIAKSFGVGEEALYLGERATETMVKKVKLNDSKVIAFATHGLLSMETRRLGSVVEPALVLTPPDKATEEDDGLLTASEITQLKMDADFVILSACNTAAGEKGNAEGLSGLAKAFFYAGARSLLVSHWPVESNAATKLTTTLFKNLKDNPELSRAEAFRRSMMSLAANDNFAHPFFWAPFSVVGEGR